MSAEVAFATIGTSIVVLGLFTYAAFRYVPMVLGEEGTEEPSDPESDEGRELPEENFAD